MPRSRLLLLACAACAACVLAGAGAPAASAKSCGTVTAFYPDVEGGSGLQLTFVTGISCRRARRVVRRCIRQRHVPGWHAQVNDFGRVEMYTTGGRRRIVMKGVAGGGPHCLRT